jgi:hypothetical protein
MLDSSRDERESQLAVLDRIEEIIAMCASVVGIAIGGVSSAQR